MLWNSREHHFQTLLLSHNAKMGSLISRCLGAGFTLSHIVNYSMQTLCLNLFVGLGLAKQLAMIPTLCIDFGHLNARTLGGIQTKADYAAILDRMAEVLGDDRARQFHVHFSRIEYSAGGEKRHWTFADTQFGPEPQPLMELLAERQLTPVVICESAGTQAEDAQAMQQMYRAARNV